MVLCQLKPDIFPGCFMREEAYGGAIEHCICALRHLRGNQSS
jgi:hypothetical protein